MKSIKNAFYALLLTCCCLTYGQQGCSSILSGTSQDGKITFFKTAFDSAGIISSAVGEIPWDTPVRLTITSACGDTSAAFFVSPELSGGYDYYVNETAEFNADTRITGFTTVFKDDFSGQTPVVSVGVKTGVGIGRVAIVLAPSVPPPPPPLCVDYTFTKCCDMYCVQYKLLGPDCHQCFIVYLQYTDGTDASYPISFQNDDMVQYCSPKEVRQVYSIVGVECNAGFGSQSRKGVGAKFSDKFTISPNPTNGEVRFEGQGVEACMVSVFDVNGRNVIRNVKAFPSVDVQHLTPGIYFYSITDANGHSQRGKMLKE
ncbi:T9SS type A sorting domain-containing protein [Flavobacterium sp.]|uniref:T9SS type A sorting domain-containing protein n=1 Tax=Flavobacterium sp. TaxID=239 RepID=UPI00262E5234|nr:T9SS type A sorting domain-containing protein [Flavobacterium sp.]